MKISQVKPEAETSQYIERAQKAKQTDKNQTAQSREVQSQQTDRVDLSEHSKEMKKIYTAQQMAPDIRTDRINAVKQLVDQNRYQVDSNAVAGKMIQESIVELKR